MKRILATLALCAAASAGAQQVTGSSLLTMLQSTDPGILGMGRGYVHGVFDTNEGLAHCAPPAAGDQAEGVVRDYLATNHAVLRLPADLLVMMVLSDKWPCKHGVQPEADKPVAPRPPRASSIS